MKISIDPQLWRGETQSLSFDAKGVWLEISLIIGKGVSLDEIVDRLAIPCDAVLQYLAKFLEIGLLKCSANGIYYSERIAKERRVSEARSRAGKRGGNPNLKNRDTSAVSSHLQTTIERLSNVTHPLAKDAALIAAEEVRKLDASISEASVRNRLKAIEDRMIDTIEQVLSFEDKRQIEVHARHAIAAFTKMTPEQRMDVFKTVVRREIKGTVGVPSLGGIW